MSNRSQKLRVAVVTPFYSEGMGYTENCLPKALAALGHDLHVITSTLNVYGNEPSYDRTYRDLLGPAQVASGSTRSNGYQVHRLPPTTVSNYVTLKGLTAKTREVAPDIVHSLEIASLLTFELALLKPFVGYRLFCETHQHLSIVKPFLRQDSGAVLKKAYYRFTRTLPTYLASHAVEKCYAIAPDCAQVASEFFGVPASKIKVQSLGTDTDLFHPVETQADVVERQTLRQDLGFANDDIVCVYTGRFSRDKNPAFLAKAIDALCDIDPRFKGLFIGNGMQKEEIAACRNTRIVPFMRHADLAAYYRVADIAVWPTQESMSMLDAASSGLPLVVSNRIGERERVTGNGEMYEQDSMTSLITDALRRLADAEVRRAYGAEGRRKMLEGFSWMRSARSFESDFLAALDRGDRV